MTHRPESVAQNSSRPVYLLRIQRTRPGGDKRDLRWILKKLLRQFGFRCLTIQEEA
jgi:hypothetical protein